MVVVVLCLWRQSICVCCWTDRMINRSWGGDGEWRWGLGGTSATHQKQQHFPGFVATSSVGSLHSLKSLATQHTTRGCRMRINREELMKNFLKHKHPQKQAARTAQLACLLQKKREKKEECMQRNFDVHQSCMLFVEGPRQMLKWQMASRANWINIDSGLVSLMGAQAEVLSVLSKKKKKEKRKEKMVTETQVM